MPRQYRRKFDHGDELEEIFVGLDGLDYVKTKTWRRRYVLKPGPTKHVTAGQFSQFYKLDARFT